MPNTTHGQTRPATVTVPQAARLLGVSRRTLYYAAQRGEVPCSRVGRTVRIPSRWVEEALGESVDGLLDGEEVGHDV